jgi:hypothetical protein
MNIHKGRINVSIRIKVPGVIGRFNSNIFYVFFFLYFIFSIFLFLFFTYSCHDNVKFVLDFSLVVGWYLLLMVIIFMYIPVINRFVLKF